MVHTHWLQDHIVKLPAVQLLADQFQYFLHLVYNILPDVLPRLSNVYLFCQKTENRVEQVIPGIFLSIAFAKMVTISMQQPFGPFLSTRHLF